MKAELSIYLEKLYYLGDLHNYMEINNFVGNLTCLNVISKYDNLSF